MTVMIGLPVITFLFLMAWKTATIHGFQGGPIKYDNNNYIAKTTIHNPTSDVNNRRVRRQHSSTGYYSITQSLSQLSSTLLFLSSSSSSSEYVPPEKVTSTVTTKKPLWPKVGDIVRYTDLDGGKIDGQVLVGRISFIQQKLGKDNSNLPNTDRWVFEVMELDDVGNGYYADYSIQKRSSKRTLRDAKLVAPIAASYVRAEDAYKVPIDRITGQPMVRAPVYDLDTYLGPFGTADGQIPINITVLESDKIQYDTIKGRLIKSTILTGVIGTIIAELTKGTELAIIYAAGSLASVVYLLLLALKTDTVAQPGAPKLGSNIANLRFGTPILVLLGVAIYNQMNQNPVLQENGGIFTTVTTDQYAAAIFGFLSYRIPLFLTQIQDAIQQDKQDNNQVAEIPGSAAGMAFQLLQEKATGSKNTDATTSLSNTDALQTLLVVSGPQATGRSQLVQRFLDQVNDSRFVPPQQIDRVTDPIAFERIEQRKEFLYVDPSGRYGITKQSILNSAKSTSTKDAVVVVDADCAFVRRIVSTMNNVRIVGVWVGLEDVIQFEQRIQQDIDAGTIIVPPDETRDSIIRARMKEIVQEIEYGISSGIFEFTILNTNEDASIAQLQDAASYCFV